jgi:hypothetical protein
VGLVLIAAILLVAGLAIHRGARNRAFHRAAVRGEAEITEIRWKTVGPVPDRDRLAVPMLRFTLADGSMYEARSEAVSRRPPGEIGDRVGILYLPDQPSRVRLDT